MANSKQGRPLLLLPSSSSTHFMNPNLPPSLLTIKSTDMQLKPDDPLPPPPPAETATTFNHQLKSKTTSSLMRIIQEEECNSSSSSSIGNNSDDDEINHNDDDGDAQSPYRYDPKISTGSLDHAIQALEKALPIRNIDVLRWKIKILYMSSKHVALINTVDKRHCKTRKRLHRKRRNLLASTLLSHKNKNRAFQLSNINTGRISKKPKTATFHFASEREDTNIQNPNLSSMRSFSMVNLHQCRFGLKSTEIENR
ncbi:hypothetical protein HanHA300_Chr03g0082011 [Helianthus annuus]|nr:hypothetical protein HanHA300_Chr03g0082011 [Helianthus annuus]